MGREGGGASGPDGAEQLGGHRADRREPSSREGAEKSEER